MSQPNHERSVQVFFLDLRSVEESTVKHNTHTPLFNPASSDTINRATTVTQASVHMAQAQLEAWIYRS